MLKEKLSTIVGKCLVELGLDKKIIAEKIYFEHPNREEHGDYSTNVAMTMLGDIPNFKNPRKFAEVIIDKMKDNRDLNDLVYKYEIAGPGFINFFFKPEILIKELERIIEKGDDFGSSNWGKGKTWLIEHTSPNPNKAMHLGHLRNNVTGMAISNIWEFVSVKVFRDCIDNNRGIAIAKLMWGYLKFARKDGKEKCDIDYWYEHQDEWHKPESAGKRPDRFMDELYVKAAEDFSNNKEVEDMVRQMVVDWEKEDKKNWALWEKCLSYIYKGQQMSLERLGNKWDKVWHEHEHYKRGKEFIDLGLKKGVFRKLDDGAILTDLEKDYGITDTIVRKSDGTALYITQDLALTELKRKTFKPDKIFWVIGPEQSLALNQMFAVCDQLGIGKYEDYEHIAYGYMSIKGQGKMSSRAGNVVFIDDLIDMAKEKILEIISGEDFSKKDKANLAEVIAVGAVKYSILKVGRLTNTAFDFESSLSLDGDSGPYLQYTYARTKSVLKKSDFSEANISSKLTDLEEEELSLLRFLYRFEEVVLLAAKEYAPNYICTYLHELAQRYNAFYNKLSILQADKEEAKMLRLSISKALAQVIKNGLKLLGIEAPERM